MYLFVGLGNIGEKFKKNRHNVGFMVIDKIASIYRFPSFRKKNNISVSIKLINGKKYILAKPETFINNSGTAVKQIKSFFKITNDRIFVYHDEIDLFPSKIKYKNGGSNNGHNGLKSIDNFIGIDYNRIRIGIGRPENNKSVPKKELISKWVLSDFNEFDTKNWLNITIENLCKNFSNPCV